jgi:hypothetical protein
LGFGWAFHLGQWLVFWDDGRITAAHYAKEAAQATAEGRAVGEWQFWDRFDKSRPIQRRQHFITKLLQGTFKGLVFMHLLQLLSSRGFFYLQPPLLLVVVPLWFMSLYLLCWLHLSFL